MKILLCNGWLYFYTGSCRLELQLNGTLAINIRVLKRIASDVDNNDITKEVYSFWDLRLNHWKREDLLEAVKVAELFLPNSRKDKNMLELLPYDILQELLDRMKG